MAIKFVGNVVVKILADDFTSALFQTLDFARLLGHEMRRDADQLNFLIPFTFFDQHEVLVKLLVASQMLEQSPDEARKTVDRMGVKQRKFADGTYYSFSDLMEVVEDFKCPA